ncbi:MAG: DUF2905 domain-containing protein [Anaerolineae bacterium]|nr:DUF2905 domain-containing protein [Anaerolineae bacterium]
MDFSSLGKGILILGLVLVVVGGLLWALGRAGVPLGRLPGDIRIERDGFSCLVPVATMILVSILLTVLLNIIIRLFNR